MQTVLRVQKETTLRAILAALWNLSAHSDVNKVLKYENSVLFKRCNLKKKTLIISYIRLQVDICGVEGAIEFLVGKLTYKTSTGSMIIIENVGGILRNVSKLIAIRDDLR